jgi:hypothetical protein
MGKRKMKNIVILFIFLMGLSSRESLADEHQNHLVYRCPFDSIIYRSPRINGEQVSIDLINGETTGPQELEEKIREFLKPMVKRQQKELLFYLREWPELWMNRKNGRGILLLGVPLSLKAHNSLSKIKLGLPRIQSSGRQYRTKTKILKSGELIRVHFSQGEDIKATLAGSWGQFEVRGSCTKLSDDYITDNRGPMTKEGLQQLPKCDGTPTRDLGTFSKWDNCKGGATIEISRKGKKIRNYYEGSWTQGQYSGWGRSKLEIEGDEDNSKKLVHLYEGQFKWSKFHGYGIQTDKNGITQSGIWEAGEFQYAQKITPPVIAKKKPRSTPQKRTAASAFLRLKKLKSLFDAGLITSEEYKDKKAEILKRF